MMFRAYLRLERLTDKERKVPCYSVTAIAGYYKPLEALKTRNGIKLYLQAASTYVKTPDTRRADYTLEGNKSLNFSSLFVLNGYKPTGSGFIVGYGNPPRSETYSKLKRPNPFYEYRQDGFIFLIASDYSTIEVLVIPNGMPTIIGSAQALASGVFDVELATARKAAIDSRQTLLFE